MIYERVSRSYFFKIFKKIIKKTCKITKSMLYYSGTEEYAGVMELADVLDSKSSGSDTVRVRPPPPAPKSYGDAKHPHSFLMLYSRVNPPNAKHFTRSLGEETIKATHWRSRGSDPRHRHQKAMGMQSIPIAF